MSSRLPSYLTRNFHGIFVFQYRSSNQLRSIHPQFQLLFRRSLFTRNKREALRKAKLWTIVMDELSAKLLNDPESYGRAMTLLKKYQQLEDFSWETVEAFLSGLSDGEEAILETAIQAANRGELKLANLSSIQNGTDQFLQQLLSAIQGLQPQVIIQQPLSQPAVTINAKLTHP